jgi:hypothetical protein
MRLGAIVTILCVCLACANTAESQAPSAIKPGALPFVLPGRAINPRVVQLGEGAVQYELTDRYPAEAALMEIQQALTAGGWTPLSHDLWNPGLPSSNSVGWRNFVDGTGSPKLRVYQWLGYWRNNSGDVVMHGIRYKALDAAMGSEPAGDGSGTIEIFTAQALARAKINVPKP